ncbi:hypothetical protein PV343_11310 [Streptomyces sp. WI03-4A]|uniref:hypothetical protein n=1 Tax=Streptomyces sp. WI03-4A TaxID=3028706 RepID=UPI0029A5B460|nr:hypothetical protein [Streptomyces sp. WI03-4A]MDX2592841.1 hypothetical protein [Streptomyces sp. WI03-4A]
MSARKAAEIERRQAESLPVQSSAGALSDERREQLDDIDPAWRPAWPVDWQRAFLTRQHLDAGGTPPHPAWRQFFEREGHLRVPRKHIETITIDSREDSGRDSEEAVEHHLRLGTKPGLPGTADVS